MYHSNEPLTSTDILNRGYADFTQSTVITVLRKLLNQKYVDVVGVVYSGKVLSRTYKATDLSRKAVLQHFAVSYSQFADTLGVSQLVTEILSSVDEDKQDKVLKELKEML